MIRHFCIKKLFGFRNIDISFEDNIKILIGENGLGKTTVLNALYYVLSEKYHKLYQIEFESISLKIYDDNTETSHDISFDKNELANYIQFIERKRIGNFISRLQSMVDLDELRSFITKHKKKDTEENEKKDTEIIRSFLKSNTKLRKIGPEPLIVRELLSLIKEPIFKKFNNFSTILKKLNFNILYFPTYRRVEEDLKNIGKFRRKIFPRHVQDEIYIEEIEEIEEELDISEDTLIHFGMDDVNRRITEVEGQINRSTISGFSKVTGEMLSQLLKGFPEIDDTEIEKIDVETAKIVLERVGDNLSESDKDNILSLLDTKKDLKRKKELVYFLFKLIDIYNQHKHIDDSIKQFRDVCNEYLVDKKFVYNESAVTIRIYRSNFKNEEVSLDKLSSGEKQIVSLFSRIYLERNNSLLVLFDEPELSLSIEWQKLLLPHIVKSGEFKFLLTVTHSPFIFKNNLDKYAIGMNVYVDQESQNA